MTNPGMTNHRRALLVFIVLVLGGGLFIGFLTKPGLWYASLIKPSFNPPALVFAPVWSILYVLIAIAGWRTWRAYPHGWPMRMWWTQLVLNFLWSPVFFVAHRIGLAFAIILLLLSAIVGFIVTSSRQDRVAAWLFVPYALWVTFAVLLNGSIFALNWS
jgi:translocator protein